MAVAGKSAGAAELSYRSESAKRPDLLRIGRLPIHFFTTAVIFFACGVAALPFAIGTVVEYFYQPPVLALVHTFTLGWITASIMGVMYRYVPALTRHPIQYPRLAIWQLWLFIIGTVAMISHFYNGVWVGTWFSAAIVIASVLMFAANLLPCLYRQLGRAVAETGMFLSICMLIVAASIGFILALDKTYDFLGGDVLTNLSSHVHFAALGWVTLTICAVSYRMIPAFLLPKIELPKSAIWQLWALAAGVIALGITLLAGIPGELFWTVAIALSLLAYMVTMGRLVRTRRMPIDFTARHALAGIVWLLIAIAAGVVLAAIGPQGLEGSRLASAYGALGLLGWISNFIIGMSYQLFPGFVSRVRTGAGWPMVTVAELTIKRPRALVFAAFNAGVALLVVGLMLSSIVVAQIGAAAIAVAGLVYGAMTIWTLSYAYRRALPSVARNPLRILPS
jgi:hypothetical protein